MKKFRYNPQKIVVVTPWRKAATFIYFFMGWNVLAIIGYQFLSSKYEEKNPGFSKLSSKDKYLRMIGAKEEDLTHIKISPFASKEKHEKE